LETVKRLVTADASLARAHYEYRTPLSFAVKENHVEVAAFLLANGADALALGDVLEIARERGYTEMVELLEREFARLYGASPKGEAVAAAIRDRDHATVRRLLDDAPELLHEGDARSNQPIHWAVMTRQIDIIDDLLARGADINAKRQDNAQPIHLTNGDYHYRGWRDVPVYVVTTPDDVYRHIVARGATVDIGMAAAKGDLHRVRELLDRDPSLANRVADYNSYYVGCGSAIKNAADGGHIEIVKLLLERGADPNVPEEGIAPHGHALYAAVSNGHYEIAKLLLEHGAYPNPEVESSADAVYIAIRNGDRRMVELLASYGATWDIATPRGSGLSYAEVAATKLGRSMTILGTYGDVATVAARLEDDPTLADVPDALAAAAGSGHEDFVRLLLRYQPDLAQRVTVSKPRKLAELLFEHGMDPNRPNWLRQLPLHHFAQNGDVESAALFIDHGADINARDEEHRTTPLGYAARAGKTRMVELLLKRGARLTLPDDPPWAVPLAMAKYRGHDAVVRLLVEYEKTGTLPARHLDEFESLARDLVEAFRSGSEEAFRRIISFFQIERPLMWDHAPLEQRVRRLRRMVREQLGGGSDVDVENETLDLDDARILIARAAGFENWDLLVNQSR
jgi:ankyrin repeat protein